MVNVMVRSVSMTGERYGGSEMTATATEATTAAGTTASGGTYRWPRPESELDLLERELATATAEYKETERSAVAAIGERDELRGLLGTYEAKAGRLGAEPCDLAAAEAAVSGYQQASWRCSRGEVHPAGQPPDRTFRRPGAIRPLTLT